MNKRIVDWTGGNIIPTTANSITVEQARIRELEAENAQLKREIERLQPVWYCPTTAVILPYVRGGES